MDLESDKLKLLQSLEGEERVEVNQRHLIDKILARYSSENTIFRELLQNSNDAFATKVLIHFKSNLYSKDPSPTADSLSNSQSLAQPSAPSTDSSRLSIGVNNSSFGGCKGSLFNRRILGIEYKNNGKVLKEEDYKRLRQIAQGNPDETKIGFFGVGFYSLFSICEEPFISSGGRQMGFFWKGDTLYTKSSNTSDLMHDTSQEWTTFWLKLRESMDMIIIKDFARFLSTSIGFTANIKEIQVKIDEEVVISIEKKLTIPRTLEFTKSDYVIQNEILKLKQVEMQNIQINLKIKEEVKTFMGFGESRIIEQDFSMFSRIAIGVIDVKVTGKIEKEMERTTKKIPPKETKIQIIYANYDEFQSSVQTREKTEIFTDLMPGLEEQGRVFIGFPTFQTTGCSIQLQAHLIPTVERESIDFVDPTLKFWNQEMLAMGGLLARIVAEDDLDSIQNLYHEMALDSTSEEWLQKKGNHNLLSFTFNHSTPSPIVGKILAVHFYKLSSKPIRIVSTKGLLPVSSVRLSDPELSNFFKCVPMVPPETETYCKELIKRLMNNGNLKKASFQDLFDELSQRPLNSDEIVTLFQFWITKWRQQKINLNLSNQLRSVLVLADGNQLLPMNSIKHYAMPQLVPQDLPIPNIVMPVKITRHFINPELEQALWGLTEYKVLNWLHFIIKEDRFGIDPTFTEKVMGVLSRHYASLPQQEKISISSVLSQEKCVVTRLGMKKPSDSYFKSVNLFEDLPTVHWNNSRTISDLFQKAIGVREHVELQLVFDRLLNLNWNHTQLIKYLTSVQDKLTDLELSRLRATPMFPKEMPTQSQSENTDRFLARDLFAPIESFRSFDLPLLLWSGRWRNNSEEAKFMNILGLNLLLPLGMLIQMASSSSHTARLALINYFINNYDTSYASHYRPGTIMIPFLPVDEEENLSAPSSCFTEEGAKVLGFKILHRDLKQHSHKLGVRSHPLNHALLEALKSNPPTFENATAVFNYLSSRQHDFDRDDWLQLRNIKFVPVLKNGHTTWMAPLNVYFGNSDDKLLCDQFTYIDFGISCNAFLKACGVKEEPSPIEVAQMIIRDPDDTLSERGVENYLSLLRQIASNYPMLKQNSQLISNMKKTPFLIGIKRKERNPAASNDSDVTYQLALAKEIFLIDDTVIGQLFNALGAPVESILEKMYEDLGSTWLSKQVKEVTSPIGSIFETSQARDLQKLIHERASLLLYDGQHIRNSQEIHPNSNKLLTTLKVVQVNEIEQSRNFLGVVKKQNTTACMLADRGSKAFVLYICADLDYFDVARALSRIIFKQPRLNDSLLLSTLLSTSLENLRRKGFPVDRILNLKKAMNFVEHINQSPSPHRVKDSLSSLEMEDERIGQLSSLFPDIDQSIIMQELQKGGKSENALALAANALAERSSSKESLNTTSRTTLAQANKVSEPNRSVIESSGGMLKMLNSFKKNLGFQTEKLDDQISLKSVPENRNPNHIKNAPPNTLNRSINPSNTLTIKNQLSNSISRLSTVDETRIQSKVPVDPPSSLPPQQNRCQILSDSDLVLVQNVDELRFYLDKGVPDAERALILTHQINSLERFSLVLQHLAQVFRINLGTMAMYWDQKGDTIAFNRSKSLFFNAKYYSGLHFPKVVCKNSSSIPGSYNSNIASNNSIEDEDLNTFFYWFMVFCHELAHNFVAIHDSNHEFWMSSFAEQYMGDLIVMLKRIGKI